MNGAMSPPPCGARTTRVVEMLTTAGVAALTTVVKLGGVAPLNGSFASCGSLWAAGSQSIRALSTAPKITPARRNTPATTPTRNERRSKDMQSLPQGKR